MASVRNVAAVALLAWGIISIAWWIQRDSVDIAVPDDSAIARHDPNPPMMAWRPRIPDSVGTSSFACVSLPDSAGNLSAAPVSCTNSGSVK
jgi:hypothetical protein